MTPHRILSVNAISTALCAIGMLAARGILYPLFGLDSPLVLDALAVGLLAYAAVVASVTWRNRLDRPTLMTFAILDALWVAGSAVVLVLFWNQLTPAARVLIIAVALATDAFATLQYRAARRLTA
jgi:CHASE2 domain-containing sensor protein